MLRANLVEDEETTMSRFLNGLNKEIADAVDMHHYLEYNELLMRACKVERSMKGKPKAQVYSSSTSWKKTNNEQGKRTPFKPKETPTQAGPQTFGKQGNSANNVISTSKTRDIQCFRCGGR